MSTLRRLAAGQVANIASLVVLLVSQVINVRVILNHWTATQLGAWMTIQAVVSLLSCPDWGLQDYVWIRAFQLGPTRTKTLSRLLGASLKVGAVFGLVELVIAIIVVALGWHLALLGIADARGRHLAFGSGVAFLLATVNSSIFGSVGSYINRIGQTVGMYPEVTWWTTAVYIATMAAPLLAIWQGASMASAAMAQFVAVFIASSLQAAYLLIRFAKIGIRPIRSHRPLPMLIVRRARLAYAKNILEQARQQGVRVLLALLTAAHDVAIFATTRTIANIALQAGITLSNPIMPELATLVRERRAVKIASAFTMIWIIMAVVIGPGAFVLQASGGFVYQWWTRGKLPFDPWLLGTMATGVVWSFGAFPAMALVRSQNDFVALTRVMLTSSIGLILAMVAFVPRVGALGAGIGLLVGETIVYAMIIIDAKRWMDKLNLIWPTHSIRLSQISLVLTTLSIAGLAYRPSLGLIIFPVGIAVQAVMAKLLFNDLPEGLRTKLLVKLRLAKATS